MSWSSPALRGGVNLLFRPLTAPPRTPRSLLFLSTSARCRSPDPGQGEQPGRRWSLEVSPYCSVRALLGCSISVRPLDLHSFPEADRVFIAVRGPEKEQEILHVRYEEQSKELVLSGEKLSSNLSVDLAAPVKSNIFITTRGEGNVEVKKMECDVCEVQTERGSCLLHSVKAHRVQIKSHGGHITGAGTIHGNVDIMGCGDSAVDVKKLQGTTMNVSTERGPLKVRAIYAESSCVSSRSGAVQLGHVHGNATVENGSGDTVIDGSNSSLQISSHSGAIDVYVGDGGSADLHSQEGAVCVRVPSSLRAGVELCGASVDISPEVSLSGVENNTTRGQTTVTGYLNAAPPVEQWVKARADGGAVTLKTQSWFETLKLGG